jgi:hypothetical protein
MSVRLSVLLVQSSRMSGLQSGINADLVFQLMGVAGIDLSIVNSLQDDEIAETDRLLLTSLENDLAVLDWRDPDETLESLRSIGLSGDRSPHPLDPASPAVTPGKRRFYIVDLRRGDRPSTVAESMRNLLGARRVVAVPLGLSPVAKPRTDSTPRPTTASEPIQLPIAQPLADQSSGPEKRGERENRTHLRPQPSEQTSLTPPNSLPSEKDLDALVDGLNAADW